MPLRPTRRLVLAGAGALAATRAFAAYPEKIIRLVVPLAAGGNVDIVARAVAEPLSKALGQPIVVENRPGASSLVGTQFVAKSPPDGYTLLAVASTFVSAPAIVANPGYDPVKDFSGVGLTCRIPMALLVHPDVPARTVSEFIALLKSKPGQVSYATAGTGSTGHIAAELFAQATGARMMMVPYKGNAQATIDVLSGQVNAMFDQVSTATPNVQAGKLRALGVTTRTRTPVLPDVPTIEEAGVPGYEDATINGLLVPAGTPRDVVQRLHAELAKVLAAPELRQRFSERGIELASSASPEEFDAFIAAETAKYTKLAKEANIKAE